MWILGRSGWIPFPSMCCCAVLPFLKWHRPRTELGWMMNGWWISMNHDMIGSYEASGVWRLCISFPSPRKASSTESEVNRQSVAATISLEFQRRCSINFVPNKDNFICSSYVTYNFLWEGPCSFTCSCSVWNQTWIKENLKLLHRLSKFLYLDVF